MHAGNQLQGRDRRDPPPETYPPALPGNASKSLNQAGDLCGRGLGRAPGGDQEPLHCASPTFVNSIYANGDGYDHRQVEGPADDRPGCSPESPNFSRARATSPPSDAVVRTT